MSGWTLPWRGKRYQKLAQPNAMQAKAMAVCDAANSMACSVGPNVFLTVVDIPDTNLNMQMSMNRA